LLLRCYGRLDDCRGHNRTALTSQDFAKPLGMS
jgi:hypothetical protein